MAEKRKVSGTATTTATDLDYRTVTVEQLAKLLSEDRITRRMTWPAYAEFLGVPMATIYKISRGVRGRVHELTRATIIDKIKSVPA